MIPQCFVLEANDYFEGYFSQFQRVPCVGEIIQKDDHFYEIIEVSWAENQHQVHTATLLVRKAVEK